jgi:hypothetical protein
MIKHKLIGIYQFITGIFGALLIIINFGKVYNDKEVFFTVFLGVVLFSLVAYVGYSLFKGLNNSVKYSIIALAMQSIGIIYNGTQYLLTGAAFCSFIYKTNTYNFNFQISPIAYNISEVSQSIPFELTVFIVPLIMLILLIIKK